MGDEKEIIVKNCCHTKRETQKYVFDWTFDISVLLGNDVESPKFPSEENDIYFILYIKRHPTYLVLYLKPYVCKEIKAANLYYEVQFLIASRPLAYSNVTDFSTISSYTLVSLAALKEKSGQYLLDNKLTIHCVIQVFMDKVFHNLSFNVSKCDLANNLGALFDSKELSDVTIKTSDGHEFRAHKIILCARSPVFSAMLKLPMKESLENIIAIEDFNQDVVAEMLRFIYTGDAPKLSEMSEDLLAVADKYGIARLKKMCVGYISDSLSLQNIRNILRLADLYNEPELKMRCEQFITVHRYEISQNLNQETLIKMLLE